MSARVAARNRQARGVGLASAAKSRALELCERPGGSHVLTGNSSTCRWSP